MLKTHNTDLPLIVAPNENLSILDMANILNSQVDKEIFFYFNGNLDGQFRKDGLNHALVDLLGCFKFTKFEDGVRQTYKWYLENK